MDLKNNNSYKIRMLYKSLLDLHYLKQNIKIYDKLVSIHIKQQNYKENWCFLKVN